MTDDFSDIRRVAESDDGASADDAGQDKETGDSSGGRKRKKRKGPLPDEFPVLPLGQAGGMFHFLTARGEHRRLSAGAMNNRATLVDLVAGVHNPIKVLADLAKPKTRDHGFNVAGAADKLMEACSDLPLFDDAMQIRHFGTWRGPLAAPLVHLGETIIGIDEEDEARYGRMIGNALYPAVPGRDEPAEAAAKVKDIQWICKRIGRYWGWDRPGDAAIVIGWIGQAALGQYPSWRSHMWIKGKHGSGKSTLLRIISKLLGGMSGGVRKSASAAAVRQATNRMAIARIFDEAEGGEDGRMNEVVSLFRLMSDADGAVVERGTADHGGVRFELFGAGLMGSIIPAAMTPADQSRFVVLNLSDADKGENPDDKAVWLSELEDDAEKLGAAIWRRMIDLAPGRWDRSFRVYSSLLQRNGVRARSGDTIGALLAGWDLMLHDAPLVDAEGNVDAERLEAARKLAAPLIEDAREAEEEGEGERCLRAIFSALVARDHGGVITIAELIERMQDSMNTYDQTLIGRLGLKLVGKVPCERSLFIANGQNQLLDRALAGTRWRGGGHRAALTTLDGVAPAPSPEWVAGRKTRGLVVPPHYLPRPPVEDTETQEEAVE